MSYLKSKELIKRWSIFPLIHPDLWEFYKNAENQVWKAESIDLSNDKYDDLNNEEKVYLKNILSFFTVSDGLVLENLASNFVQEVNILEAQYFYALQAFGEQVHANTYSLLIETYIKDAEEKQAMFTAIENIDTVKKKTAWAMKWLDHPSFAHRLVAFSLVEGLSFSSIFAGVFWYRSRNKMEGLCAANEEIMRDEINHYEFAIYLYKTYLKDEYKINKDEIKQMIIECCNVEKTFIEDSMPIGLQGLKKEDMLSYVENIADIILNDYGIEKYYNSPNNLEYMKRIGLSSKNNFFEQRIGTYTRVDIPISKAEMFDDNF